MKSRTACCLTASMGLHLALLLFLVRLPLGAAQGSGGAGDQGSAYLTLSFARLSSGNTGGSASSKLSAAVSDKAKASVLSTDSPSSKPAPKESPKPLSKQPQREDSQQIRRETRARPAAHQVVLKRKSQKKKARERNKSRPVVAEKRAKMAAAATVRHSAGAPAVESSGNTSENTLESPSRAGPGASVSTRAAGTGGHGSSGTGASGSGGPGASGTAAKGQGADSEGSSWDTPPRCVHFIRPVYPKQARRQGLEGQVLLRVFIDDRGHATRAVVLQSSDTLFAAPARQAALKSRFKPAIRNNRPVSVWVKIPMRFRLDE